MAPLVRHVKRMAKLLDGEVKSQIQHLCAWISWATDEFHSCFTLGLLLPLLILSPLGFDCLRLEPIVPCRIHGFRI